jgi:hypothetical protein
MEEISDFVPKIGHVSRTHLALEFKRKWVGDKELELTLSNLWKRMGEVKVRVHPPFILQPLHQVEVSSLFH